ncbi:MAG: PBP1A family penicillin-binding protein [Actinobacteria bacterium]|nr:PBP1A family penicillin-binding protein [Actinomycetota bacterium]
MSSPRRSRSRRLLSSAILLALLGGACSYTVPLEPVSSVARSTFIYDAQGNIIARLHAEEDREPVTLDKIAPVLQEAVIAIEDERFYAHNGVDLRATFRALSRNLEGGEVIEGGSTITQQYVKNVLIGRERTVGRKIKEASLAYQMERNFTKETILERYLNTIYFGNGAYGAESAAARFFGKHATEVTLAQAALLAGMIRAPERYDPFENPERAEARRQLVLRRMLDQGMITEAELEQAAASPPEVQRPDEEYAAGHYVEAVKRFILESEEFGETRQERRDLLFKGGLHIHTNLDMRMQEAAQNSVAQALESEDQIISALVALEPTTGKVRAVWGGYEFFGPEKKAKFDFATVGRRQAGSAFKPFTLTAALTEGIGPTQVYPAPGNITLKPDKYGPEWKVGNYGGGGYGALTLIDATVRSVNTVYAQLILDVGPKIAVDMARDMGIKSELKDNPAAVLGTNDVSPLDMASAYGTLAADGVQTDPKFVDRIEDSDGKTVYSAPETRRRVVSKVVARNVTKILRRVVSGGTATAARLEITDNVAGKTGTAQAWRNAWFVGYSTSLVTAVWVGNPDKPVSMRPPLTKRTVTGGSYPATIWSLFMDQALQWAPPGEFPEAPEFKATKKIKTSLPCDQIFPPAGPDGQPAPPGVDPESLADDGYSDHVIAAAEQICGTTTTTTTIPGDPNATTTIPGETTTTAAGPAPTDTDGDGLLDTIDNCPGVSNPAQTNLDGDGRGADCDANDSDPNV